MELFSCLVVQIFAVVASWNCTCQNCGALQNKTQIDVSVTRLEEEQHPAVNASLSLQ